jgi:hypothetical protein
MYDVLADKSIPDIKDSHGFYVSNFTCTNKGIFLMDSCIVSVLLCSEEGLCYIQFNIECLYKWSGHKFIHVWNFFISQKVYYLPIECNLMQMLQ